MRFIAFTCVVAAALMNLVHAASNCTAIEQVAGMRLPVCGVSCSSLSGACSTTDVFECNCFVSAVESVPECRSEPTCLMQSQPFAAYMTSCVQSNCTIRDTLSKYLVSIYSPTR
jgi:hypothetical protein